MDEKTIPHLQNITFRFLPGKIYGIGGKIGSGKSGLLSAMLKTIPFYSGTIKTQGTISYVEQEPTIFAGTIRDNIVFER